MEASTIRTEKPRNTVTIKTSDDILIEVDKSVAMEFGIVKLFFEDDTDAAENSVSAMPLQNVSEDVLTRVITYCQKHLEFRANSTPEEEVKSFDADFVKRQSTEMLLEITLAANYLEVMSLLDLMLDSVVDRIQNKSVEYVRQLFQIENDFTPDEEEAIRRENAWAFEGVDRDD